MIPRMIMVMVRIVTMVTMMVTIVTMMIMIMMQMVVRYCHLDLFLQLLFTFKAFFLAHLKKFL